MCSAVLLFPTQNSFGRTQATLVILIEEAFKASPLSLESAHWGKGGAGASSKEKLLVFADYIKINMYLWNCVK